MATYTVGADSKAQKGLKAGDQVVTGGGTYTIDSVNADGTYKSTLTNKDQTTANYNTTPSKDTSGWIGGQLYDQHMDKTFGVGNWGNGMGNNAPRTNEGGSGSTYTGSSASSQYSPVNQDDYMSKVMSFEQAQELAKNVLTPQYQSQYEQSAAQAAQRLGSSGLNDSVYGQALAADAQRDIDRDLQAAIQSLALQLQGKSSEEAMNLLRLAVEENQFGANYNQNAALQDRAYYERMLDRNIAQANTNRDYALAQQGQDLKTRIQNFAEKQANWEMGGFDSAFQMQQALMQLEQQAKAKSGGGGVVPDLGVVGGVAPEGASAPATQNTTGYNPLATGGFGQYATADTAINNTGAQASEATEAANIAGQVRSRGITNPLQALDYINSATNSPTVAVYAMATLGITQDQFAQWQARNA